MPRRLKVIAFPLLLGTLGVPSLFAQEAECPLGASACVKDIDPSGEYPSYPNSGSSNLIIEEEGSVYPTAVVRDIPEQSTWGWEPVDVMDDSPLPGPQGYPAGLAQRMICARSPNQALAWISTGGLGDEGLLNRAMGAYDWKGRKSGQVEGTLNWLANWPRGYWEQQVEYRIYDNSRAIPRYRFVSETGQPYAWVRLSKNQGCWFVRQSAPKVYAEDMPTPTSPIHPQPGASVRDISDENLEQQGQLQILWEAGN